MKPYVTFMTPRRISDTSCGDNQNTRFLFNNFFFQRSYRLKNNVKSCRSGQTAVYDIILRIKDAVFVRDN